MKDVDSILADIDALLPCNDGLKWFNKLYLLVLREVEKQRPALGWRDPAWVSCLDLIFVACYLSTLRSALNGAEAIPAAWRPLFEMRKHPAINRVRFALAGMNAHLSHDLPLALSRTNARQDIWPLSDGAQHADFASVNDILCKSLRPALSVVARSVSESGQESQIVEKLLDVWDIRTAREKAWSFADHLKRLQNGALETAIAKNDHSVEMIGRGMLLGG
jgi:hypothetical protein